MSLSESWSHASGSARDNNNKLLLSGGQQQQQQQHHRCPPFRSSLVCITLGILFLSSLFWIAPSIDGQLPSSNVGQLSIKSFTKIKKKSSSYVAKLPWHVPPVPNTSYAAKVRTDIGAVPTTTATRGRSRMRVGGLQEDRTLPTVDPLQNCSVTCQVRIEIEKSNQAASGVGETTTWILYTVDEHGVNKTVGGDEFYVSLNLEVLDPNQSDPVKNTYSIAVAFVEDRNDGSYRLDFVQTPLSSKSDVWASLSNETFAGTLAIHFEYSCDIGRLGQPSKRLWKGGGSTGISHLIPINQLPPIRPFVPPNQDFAINFSKFDTIVAYGDSLIEGFVSDKGTFLRPNFEFHGTTHWELTVATYKRFTSMLRIWHGKTLILNSSIPTTEQPKVALVLGSAMWDLLQPDNIQRNNFDDHLKACARYIDHTRQAYPGVQIFWKSPTAAHIHRVVGPTCDEKKECRERVKYLSSSRTFQLYKLQRDLMQTLNVPLLDIYRPSYLSAASTPPGDGRHYGPSFNKLVLEWFYG